MPEESKSCRDRSTTATPEESPTNPLKNASFRWFFVGRVVSVLGSAMTPVALTFAVLQMKDGEHLLGTVLASELIPMLVFLIVGGGVADRYRRDSLLRLTNIGAALTQAGMAYCVIAGTSVWWLIPLALVNGTLQAFSSPALQGIVPQLVDPGSVRQANSMLSTSRNAARIIGPVVAGLLVETVGGGWAVAIDAASFAFAAACMGQVALPALASSRSGGLLHGLREGWSYFIGTSWIWSITAAFAVMNAIQVGVWQVLGPIIAKASMGAANWGLVLSARGVGLLLASMVMLRMSPPRPLVSGLLAMSLTALPLALLGEASSSWLLIAASFLSGLGSSYFGVVWDTTRQTRIPRDLISRVTSYDDFGAYAAIPVGQLLVLPISLAAGMGPVAVGGAILYFLTSLTPLCLKSVRGITEPPRV